MKKITWKLVACFMAVLLLCMPVLTGCGKHEDNFETTEQGTTKKVSEGLEFTSNGDGTCYVSGIGTCTDTHVVIPSKSPEGDSVTSIGFGAFKDYIGFSSVTIPDSVTSIESSAFFFCTNLKRVTIPDSVESIGHWAFNSCLLLKSITIPASVKSIDVTAFQECINLSRITVDKGNTVYHSTNNCLIETQSKTLIKGCPSSKIPADGSVTSIGPGAFSGYRYLKRMTIPDSVTSIGICAFEDCTGLTSITIPDSVTSIEGKAFYDCTGLTSITIPDSVTYIGDWAFQGCTSLTDVHFSGTKEQWQAMEIEDGNDPLSTATIHCTDGDITPKQ